MGARSLARCVVCTVETRGGFAMRHEVVVLLLLAGCSTPSPTPVLAEYAEDSSVYVVPAVESPSETPLQSSDVTDLDPPRAAPSTDEPRGPAIDPTMAKLGGPACPNPASTCGVGCRPIEGMKLDEANQCYVRLTIGCMRSASAVNGAATCAVGADGAIFAGSPTELHQLGSGWGVRPCTPEEWGTDGTTRPMCP